VKISQCVRLLKVEVQNIGTQHTTTHNKIQQNTTRYNNAQQHTSMYRHKHKTHTTHTTHSHIYFQFVIRNHVTILFLIR